MARGNSAMMGRNDRKNTTSRPVKVYLDVCCLNRPFDDQMQDRVRLEAEAVLVVLSRIRTGIIEWVSSEVVDFEIRQIPDPERRLRVGEIARNADLIVELNDGIVGRAEQLEGLGFHALDALHLACAESGGATVFLSTDDRLVAHAARNATLRRIKTENPLSWVREEVLK